MLAKHLFAFMTLVFFVVMSNMKEELSAGTIVLVSLGIYLWFLMSTRLHLYVWITLIIFLGTIYLLQLFENNLKDKNESSDAITIKNIQLAKKYLTYLFLPITAITAPSLRCRLTENLGETKNITHKLEPRFPT